MLPPFGNQGTNFGLVHLAVVHVPIPYRERRAGWGSYHPRRLHSINESSGFIAVATLVEIPSLTRWLECAQVKGCKSLHVERSPWAIGVSHDPTTAKDLNEAAGGNIIIHNSICEKFGCLLISSCHAQCVDHLIRAWIIKVERWFTVHHHLLVIAVEEEIDTIHINCRS